MIHTTDTTLSAYVGAVIKSVGTCTLTYRSKVGSSTIMFYVVPITAQPILGLEDCIKVGLIRFTHMPFGLTSATEVFQKKNEAVFAGIEGIHIVAYVIITLSKSI